MSIRLRLALVFACASAVVFAGGSWLFVAELSRSLQGSVDAQLAVEVAQADRYLPAPGSPAPTRGSAAPGEYVVQVVDPAGRVRGSSPDAGRTPMLGRALLTRAARGRVLTTTTGDGERQRVLAVPLPGRPGWVALAGVSLETLDGTVRKVVGELVVAGIVLVLAAALGAYGLARAALSPVERMRREVADLSEREDAAGVRVPGTRDEIAALATTMNQLLARLRGALARQRELVADASHELRTPFAVLSGELELAGRPGRSREELEGAVSRAGEEAARLARLTDRLLTLARSDEDRLSVRREPVVVADLLSASASRASGRGAALGVRCEVAADPALVAELDVDRLGQALDNLVDNALRYAPPGTAVRLAGRAEGDQLVVEVGDSGPGFPEDFLPRAFERFARPDSSRGRREGGAGLGLAVVEAVARAHGGSAQAENRPEGGAVVRLRLPRGPRPSGSAGSSGRPGP